MIDLSISIVNTNNCELLEKCLFSIYENTKKISFEIFVIDNNSSDGSSDMVKNKFPEVNLIMNKEPLGFAKNHNQVIKIAKGKYVLLLNEDTLIFENTFDLMVDFMDKNPICGVCGPKVLNGDGSLQHSCRSFPDRSLDILLAGFFHHTFLSKLFPNNRFTKKYLMLDWDHNQISEVDWLSGCCFMIRKEVIDKIGLLDDNFVMFVEDVDFCYRAKKEGYKTYYLPSAKIIHYGSKSTEKQPLKMIFLHHKSMFRFYKKHYMVRGRLKYIIILGLTLRCILAITENRLGYFKSICRKVLLHKD